MFTGNISKNNNNLLLPEAGPWSASSESAGSRKSFCQRAADSCSKVICALASCTKGRDPFRKFCGRLRFVAGVPDDAAVVILNENIPLVPLLAPPNADWVTLVTLVSHTQLLWRGVTQGGVAPVFPFRASP
jgi:hypothetical protein